MYRFAIREGGKGVKYGNWPWDLPFLAGKVGFDALRMGSLRSLRMRSGASWLAGKWDV